MNKFLYQKRSCFAKVTALKNFLFWKSDCAVRSAEKVATLEKELLSTSDFSENIAGQKKLATLGKKLLQKINSNVDVEWTATRTFLL